MSEVVSRFLPSQTNAEITKVDTYVKTMEEALKVNTRVVMCLYVYVCVCVRICICISITSDTRHQHWKLMKVWPWNDTQLSINTRIKDIDFLTLRCNSFDERITKLNDDVQPRLQKVEKFVGEFGMMIDTKFAEVYSVSAHFFFFI